MHGDVRFKSKSRLYQNMISGLFRSKPRLRLFDQLARSCRNERDRFHERVEDRTSFADCRRRFRGARRDRPYADGYESSAPAAPARREGRKFTYSFNIDGTSDYVFRGISQTVNDPAVQGGVDLGYGIIYAGAWASGLDFGDDPAARLEGALRSTGTAASGRRGNRRSA